MDSKTISILILRTILIIINNIYVIPMYLVWMVMLLPLRIMCPSVYWYIEGHLFKWMLGMVGNFMWTAGYTVREFGDDVTPYTNEECLVVCNHQSTGDVPTLMYSFYSKTGVCNKMMWIMDIMFKYTNFGFVSQVHKDFFIMQGKESREQQLSSLKHHLEQVYYNLGRKWLVIFPEGGFLWKRREMSKRYAEKHGYPVLHNVTLPRTAGMEVILKTLSPNLPQKNGFHKLNGVHHSPLNGHGEGLKYLIDITIGYPEGKPLDGLCILGGHRPPCETAVLYRVYPIQDIPCQGEALLMWMYKRWEEKEELLQSFYSTGRFPQELSTGGLKQAKQKEELLELNKWKMLAIHIFYISSAYMQYVLARNIVTMVF